MNPLEAGHARKEHPFAAMQSLLLFHGLRLLADLRIFIPKEHVLMEFEHLGSDKEPSRLPTVEEDDTGTTILVKKGEGIRLKIRDEEGKTCVGISITREDDKKRVIKYGMYLYEPDLNFIEQFILEVKVEDTNTLMARVIDIWTKASQALKAAKEQ